MAAKAILKRWQMLVEMPARASGREGEPMSPALTYQLQSTLRKYSRLRSIDVIPR